MKDKKTYIVDDDFIFRAASEVLIKSEKLTKVATLENGLLALENLLAVAENSPEDLPDLLLLDINMPVMNGWEFWRL